MAAVLVAVKPESAAAAPDTLLAQAPRTPTLEPASVEALKRLGDHLATLRSFEITSTITFDYVLDNDQKILIGGTVRHRVRRPDRLRVDLAIVAERDRLAKR